MASPSLSATPAPPSPGPQTNPVDRDSVRTGGDLRIGVPAQAQSWNPWDSSPFDLDPVLDAMTPRLYATAPDGAMHWDPVWLASEPAVQRDGASSMTVTYELNPRDAWSDGAPITVADFEATWRECLASPGPICAGRGFEHVTGIGPGTAANQVVVSYDGDYSEWAYTFARGPSRAWAIQDHTAWDSLDGKQGAFSGPYVFSFAAGATVTLARNPVWWGPYPKLDSIQVGVADDPVLGYLRQDIDGFWVGDANLFARASSLAGIQTRRSTGGDARFLVMDCSSGPLADPVVRRAVLMGLDRGRLAASDLAGWKWDQSVLNSPVWLPGQTQYVDLVDWTGDGSDAATALLDEAGWIESADGIRSRAGVELTWDFLVPQGDSLAENEGFGLRVQLAGLGVRLELSYVDPSQAAGEHAMAGATWRQTTPVGAIGRFERGNPSGYSNPEVDSLGAQALTQMDPAAREELLDRVATILWADAPAIPLYEVPEVFMVRDGLANYGPDELGTILWENVGWV